MMLRQVKSSKYGTVFLGFLETCFIVAKWLPLWLTFHCCVYLERVTFRGYFFLLVWYDSIPGISLPFFLNHGDKSV